VDVVGKLVQHARRDERLEQDVPGGDVGTDATLNRPSTLSMSSMVTLAGIAPRGPQR